MKESLLAEALQSTFYWESGTEHLPECFADIGVGELKSCRLQSLWQHPIATQNKCLPHLTVKEFDSNLRDRDDRRAIQKPRREPL